MWVHVVSETVLKIPLQTFGSKRNSFRSPKFTNKDILKILEHKGPTVS